MKATDLLKRQHREVGKLFAQALKSENPRERKELAAEICEKLELHTALEEEIFYPAYRAEAGTQKGEDRVMEAYEEHHVVKLVLAEVPGLDPSAENFTAKMTVLKELVEHHVEEEEDEMFPDAEKRLGADRLRELGEQIASRL
jgi:hemerythrin superfamily protein